MGVEDFLIGRNFLRAYQGLVVLTAMKVIVRALQFTLVSCARASKKLIVNRISCHRCCFTAFQTYDFACKIAGRQLRSFHVSKRFANFLSTELSSKTCHLFKGHHDYCGRNWFLMCQLRKSQKQLAKDQTGHPPGSCSVSRFDSQSESSSCSRATN